jgi:hypothetical protein
MAFDRDGARRTRRSKDAMCAFYLAGKCTYGDECKFSHSTSSGDTSRIPQCKFWLQGTCRHGSTCMFSHNTNAPIARVNTVTTTEEQIENLTKNMLDGTTSATVLPNGVLQYYNAGKVSDNKIFCYPPAPAAMTPQMYYYPTAQGGYISSNGQMAPMVTAVGVNYAMLSQNGRYQMVQPTAVQGAGLEYAASASAQLTVHPAPMPNSSVLKRKLGDTDIKAEQIAEASKKIRQKATVHKTFETTQSGKFVLSGGAGLSAQNTGSSMVVVPLKPGRPLVNLPQKIGIQTAPRIGPQPAPASYMILNRQNQLISNQVTLQQATLQNQALIQYHALQRQMASRPPG